MKKAKFSDCQMQTTEANQSTPRREHSNGGLRSSLTQSGATKECGSVRRRGRRRRRSGSNRSREGRSRRPRLVPTIVDRISRIHDRPCGVASWRGTSERFRTGPSYTYQPSLRICIYGVFGEASREGKWNRRERYAER